MNYQIFINYLPTFIELRDEYRIERRIEVLPTLKFFEIPFLLFFLYYIPRFLFSNHLK